MRNTALLVLLGCRNAFNRDIPTQGDLSQMPGCPRGWLVSSGMAVQGALLHLLHARLSRQLSSFLPARAFL